MYQDTSDTVPSYHDLQTLMKWRHITKSVFAIRLGSMLTIVICYVFYLQYCVLLWSMTFYTYDFCITKNRCMNI
jgi:hypothetical protein